MSPAARLMSGITLIIVPTIQYGGYFHDADRGIVDRLLSQSTRGGGHDHCNRASSWIQVRSGLDVRHTERRWPPAVVRPTVLAPTTPPRVRALLASLPGTRWHREPEGTAASAPCRRPCRRSGYRPSIPKTQRS